MNESWPLRALADVCSRITSGGTPSRRRSTNFAQASDGHLWVKSQEIRDSSVRDTAERISDEGLATSAAKYIRPSSVLVAMYGATLGKLALLKVPATVNQAICGLETDPEKTDHRWLYYSLVHWRAELMSQAQGAAQQNLNQGLIRQFQIPVPDIGPQRNIAAVLSAYDELIENNLRRIEILGEMAQAIYREWFVNFRFPGHKERFLTESTPGPIPNGWSTGRLGEYADKLVDGDWIETKDQGGSDYRLLQVSNIGVGRFRETGKYRFITSETFERLGCTEIKLGDILISRMPDPIGRAWLVDYLEDPAVTAVDVAILTPPSDAAGSYLSQWLNFPSTLAHAEIIATGTTRKRIPRSVLSTMELVVPSEDVLKKYGELVLPMQKLITNLYRQNSVLGSARDLLLPKLISGEIDVSDLDIDTSWLAA